MLLDQNLEEIRELLGDESPDDRLLLAEVDLGEDAAQFAQSDLGRYVFGRMNGEIADFAERLKRTLPWRRRHIDWLQGEIFKRETFKQYILQAINQGRSALTELSARQSEAE